MADEPPNETAREMRLEPQEMHTSIKDYVAQNPRFLVFKESIPVKIEMEIV